MRLGWLRDRKAHPTTGPSACDHVCRAERRRDEYIVGALRDAAWRPR